jgi:hypothetical protein
VGVLRIAAKTVFPVRLGEVTKPWVYHNTALMAVVWLV